jgi:hypothetical protein
MLRKEVMRLLLGVGTRRRGAPMHFLFDNDSFFKRVRAKIC